MAEPLAVSESGGRLSVPTRKRYNLTIALAGNPNTGKSTLFNELTGMHQYVGNWPGKTVERAEGLCKHRNEYLRLIDLPGTYSLHATSQEEIITRDYLLGGGADVVIVLADATNLERTLYFVLQCLEIHDRVVVALNMMDDAEQRGLTIDEANLSRILGVPVVPIAAAKRRGLDELLQKVVELSREGRDFSSRCFYGARIEAVVRNDYSGDLRTDMASDLYRFAHFAVREVVRESTQARPDLTRRVDAIVTHKWLSFPIMLVALGIILGITMFGAAPLSEALGVFFIWLAVITGGFLDAANAPFWISGPLVDGVIVGVGTVVAVMLPTMAIFFVLFALLDDSGFIPRIALNMDRPMQAVGSQGKHCLTCMMGYGCNIPGVMSARILEGSHRLIAVITNSLIPCNGRIGIILPMAILFFGAIGPLVVVVLFLISMGTVMASALLLSRTVLKGQQPTFAMELPPYRRPQFLRVIVRTLRKRVGYVLVRAAAVAAPITLLIWFMSNYPVGGGFEHTLTGRLMAAFEPVGRFLGLDGGILTAILFALPAKELVIGALAITNGLAADLSGSGLIEGLLVMNWSSLTAFNFLLFYMFCMPCAYTGVVIYKETRSFKWTAWAILLPFTWAVLLTVIAYRIGTALGFG